LSRYLAATKRSNPGARELERNKEEKKRRREEEKKEGRKEGRKHITNKASSSTARLPGANVISQLSVSDKHFHLLHLRWVVFGRLIAGRCIA
jgi:hypothetical protein